MGVSPGGNNSVFIKIKQDNTGDGDLQRHNAGYVQRKDVGKQIHTHKKPDIKRSESPSAPPLLQFAVSPNHLGRLGATWSSTLSTVSRVLWNTSNVCGRKNRVTETSETVRIS